MAMPPTAPPSADAATQVRPVTAARVASQGTAWATLGRHQLGSLVATMVDFGTMIALHEGLHLSPVLGTAIGATLGGITNFSLGRTWIFRSQSGKLGSQAVRYALVSGASACWNALGEYLLASLLRVPYVTARAVVSIMVSLLWNYPMQREFVFREGRAAKDGAR
jgi:putative flippase GtrA